jgi:hypothetical protein
VADASGQITSIAVAAQATTCGTATFNSTTGLFSVGGVVVPASLVGANATLAAVLDAAVDAGATVCIEATVDQTTGLFASVGVDVTFSACGTVVIEADGDAVVGGVTLPAALIDAEMRSALQAAAAANANACVTFDAATSGGTTTASVTVTATICATVTGRTANTITLGGVTLQLGGSLASTIQVGDQVCGQIVTGPSGNPVFTDVRTVTSPGPGSGPAGSGPGGSGPGGTGPALPDSATQGARDSTIVLVGLLAVLAGATARRFALARR